MFVLLPAAKGLEAQSGSISPNVTTGLGEVRGRVVEAGTARGIAGGSVAVHGSGGTGFAGGALLRPDGSFRVDGLTPGVYSVRARALGFAPLVRDSVTISTTVRVIELGTLELSPVATKLESQVVTAERSEVTLAPDRTSYNTKNMTVASGGTALDVLRSIPLVEIDATNSVVLRGNANVVVQINGRSSPLRGEQLAQFLAQLPSGIVVRVEVATNPSAKEDPEGTAGIINIVLNQEAHLGLSGGLTAAIGTTTMASLSGNVGRKFGPLTLFLSGSASRDRRSHSGLANRTNLAVTTPAFVESHSQGSSKPLSQSGVFRSEYQLTARDVLSADAIVSGGRFGRENAAFYADLDGARNLVQSLDQFSAQTSHSLSQDYTLAFRRTRDPASTLFAAEVRYAQSNWSTDTDLSAAVHEQTPGGPTMISRTRDAAAARMPSWNLQVDYTHHFGARTKLESGLRGTLRTNETDLRAVRLSSATGQWMPDTSRTNAFEYQERMNAAYAVLSHQAGSAQTQLGLRLEEAWTQFAPSSGQTYDRRYASAFPSAIVSYNFNSQRLLKLSYSRRVTRPSPGQVSPIVYRDDARREFRGNPALEPEYTDAFEFTVQEARRWGSVQLNPYLRMTAHAVRYIQLIDTAGVTISTFGNVASNRVAGADLNINHTRGRFTFFGGGSAWRYTSDAANLAGNLSTRATGWTARSNLTWRFSPRTDAQLFTTYRAPFKTEGGSHSAFVMLHIVARHKLWGDQGSLSLRISDPFDMIVYGYRSVDSRAIEFSERHIGQRGAFVILTRNFGRPLKLQSRQQDPETQPTPQPGPP